MNSPVGKRSLIFVLFGARGDLSLRRIVPALFNMNLNGQIPERFVLIGVDRDDSGDEAIAEYLREGVAEHSHNGPPGDEEWKSFARRIRYVQADLANQASYNRLREMIEVLESRWHEKSNLVFYLATPPSLFVRVTRGLGNAGLANDAERARIVVEKPLGRDLKSFREINKELNHFFRERQIFRIDHFLGKETVQNILALRFANPIFEPIWNRRYIDYVTITVAETLGVEHRGRYYDRAGALRDMVQNHLIQILCLVAMEPPVAYDAEDIRSKKVDVLRALRSIPKDAVSEFAARGQYAQGWINGVKVSSYRDEPDVDPRSNKETYAAVKLYVDNWRWQEVPFYLRTGKRMAMEVSEVSIRFRDVPHRSFPASAGLDSQPVRLVIQIQPEEGIVLKFMAKEPGSLFHLRPVDMRFSYKEAFTTRSPSAYETLLWNVMIGDSTLFMRTDQVEAAWNLLMPVLEAWQDNPATDFPNYAVGSWGPGSANVLIARDGKTWFTPTVTKPRSRA